MLLPGHAHEGEPVKENLAMKRTIHTIGAVLLALCACKQSSNTSGGEGKSVEKASGETKAAAGDIVIGVLADLTGPTADVGKPYTEGMVAYIDNLNAAGGIKGHKINAMSEDYAYKVPTPRRSTRSTCRARRSRSRAGAPAIPRRCAARSRATSCRSCRRRMP